MYTTANVKVSLLRVPPNAVHTGANFCIVKRLHIEVCRKRTNIHLMRVVDTLVCDLLVL